MQAPFCSRDTRFKSPFGALPAGDTLRLRLFLEEMPDRPVEAVFLELRPDDQKQPDRLPLSPDEDGEGGRWWTVETALPTGLYWYRFSWQDQDGSHPITRFDGGWGGFSDQGAEWQLTVYDKEFSTPGWLSGGIFYQIFPDRFRKGLAHDQPGDRFLRDDWGGQPAFRLDGTSRSLGNDYFGGDLKGVEEKLPYLSQLGVSCLYLNPIFEAHSNHRYNTADYLSIDPGLGDEADFRSLCEKAAALGIRVILDGVFSHTGDDSRYFNRKKRYADLGAYNSKESPCFPWFKFQRWPDKYDAWWGIDTLPETEELNEGFSGFITGEDGVLRRWLRAGAAGWRLDVADELPDGFLDKARAAVKAEKPDGLLLGEVWEDASNKISYGARRRFLQGGQLDSVMNYPFRDAVIAFLTGGDAWKLNETVMALLENYPAPAVRVLMNHIGTHDTPRILTVLGGEPMAGKDREWQARQTMTAEQREKGLRFLRLAALLQFTLPGVPSIYYGDEIGLEGYGDPFNRGCFDWAQVSDEAARIGDTLPAEGPILDFYRALGRFRRQTAAFDGGGYIPVYAGTGHMAYIREKENSRVLIALNRWCDPETLDLPGPEWEKAAVLAGNPPAGGKLMIPAEGFAVLVLDA